MRPPESTRRLLEDAQTESMEAKEAASRARAALRRLVGADLAHGSRARPRPVRIDDVDELRLKVLAVGAAISTWVDVSSLRGPEDDS
jgi:hypothetical protein